MLHPSKTISGDESINFLEILEKGAIQVFSNQNGDGFLSNQFLFEKKVGGHLPVINVIQLKKNTFINTSITSKRKVYIFALHAAKGHYMFKLQSVAKHLRLTQVFM